MKFRIRFREKEVLRDEKGEIISRTTVDSWLKNIEASSLKEALEIANQKAKKIMEEDPMAEITCEAEIPINPRFSW